MEIGVFGIFGGCIGVVVADVLGEMGEKILPKFFEGGFYLANMYKLKIRLILIDKI